MGDRNDNKLPILLRALLDEVCTVRGLARYSLRWLASTRGAQYISTENGGNFTAMIQPRQQLVLWLLLENIQNTSWESFSAVAMY